VAPQVELADGPNPLVATATVGASSATTTSTVTFNAPPQVVITSPRNGAFLEAATTDVEGFVDDPTAFVDVEGIVARVDSAGRFVAQGVSVPNGTSSLTARAVDAFGAAGTDSVEVTREDGVVGRLRVVVVLPDRRGFGFEEEIEEQDPIAVVAEDGAEFRAVLAGLGLPPSGFEPAVENVHLGFHTQDLHIFVFAEAGTIGALVSVPAIFDEFFNFGDSAPLEPISDLELDVTSSGLGLAIVPELLPSDFDPNGFAHFDVFIPVGN